MAGPNIASPSPVAKLRNTINIKTPVLSPVSIVAELHMTMLETIIAFLLNLSPKYPEMGTSSANTKLNMVAISPTSAAVSFMDSCMSGRTVLNTCLSAWFRKNAAQSSASTSHL